MQWPCRYLWTIVSKNTACDPTRLVKNAMITVTVMAPFETFETLCALGILETTVIMNLILLWKTLIELFALTAQNPVQNLAVMMMVLWQGLARHLKVIIMMVVWQGLAAMFLKVMVIVIAILTSKRPCLVGPRRVLELTPA